MIAAPGAFTGLKYGPSASDLLSEQVDVTYQIINLQMLLDRSLSDRLLNSSFNARLQTVVGFNVSIDPPRNAENAVALVEITLAKNADPCEAGKKCGEPTPCSANTTFVDSPSLVASMPQEHTGAEQKYTRGRKGIFMITFEDAENIVRASVAKSRGPGSYRTDEALTIPSGESGTHLQGLIETIVSDPHLGASRFLVDPERLATLAGPVTIDSLANELRLSTRKLCFQP